jgi:hypothetical protein
MEISPMSRKRPFDTSTASAARAVPALVAPLGRSWRSWSARTARYLAADLSEGVVTRKGSSARLLIKPDVRPVLLLPQARNAPS